MLPPPKREVGIGYFSNELLSTRRTEKRTHFEFTARKKRKCTENIFEQRALALVLVSTDYEAVSVWETLAKSGLRGSQRIPQKIQETYL